MPANETYRSLSLWLDSVPGPLAPIDPLSGDVDVDVAIAGAGFTGLWTAYYLAGAQRGLRVAVCEANIAGFGASGRNGGWCSALFPASLAKLTRMAGRDAAIAMYRAMQRSVDEVGRVAAAEGIDCHWAKGGTVHFARSATQLERARAEIAEAREYGFGEEDLRLLTAAEAREHAEATDVLGATYTPHCAAIHPARLVRGLAEAVRRRGVAVHEATPVTEIAPGSLRTPMGTVRARYVIRATEGYTPRLPGLERAIAPVYSLMIATEPLPEEVWAQVGLTGRPTFGDHRHMIIYGQRTADGRLAFGGRGAPYHLGSAIRPDFDRDPRVFEMLRRTLTDLFPVLGRREGDAHLGWPAGHPARLVRLRRAGPRHRPRLGGRLCRRRCLHHEPGRADPGRPDPGDGQRSHPAAVGEPPLAALGGRAAAVAGDEHRPARHELGRQAGGAHRPPVPCGTGVRPVPG